MLPVCCCTKCDVIRRLRYSLVRYESQGAFTRRKNARGGVRFYFLYFYFKKSRVEGDDGVGQRVCSPFLPRRARLSQSATDRTSRIVFFPDLFLLFLFSSHEESGRTEGRGLRGTLERGQWPNVALQCGEKRANWNIWVWTLLAARVCDAVKRLSIVFATAATKRQIWQCVPPAWERLHLKTFCAFCVCVTPLRNTALPL